MPLERPTDRALLALGDAPIEDARHLLAPVPLPAKPKGRLAASAPAPPRPAGPDPGTEFVVDAFGERPAALLDVAEALSPPARAALDFPQVWGRPPGTLPESGAAAGWFPIGVTAAETMDHATGALPVGGIALAWPLTGLAAEGEAAARTLAGYVAGAGRIVRELGWDTAAALRETPEGAAARADRLNRLKDRFARAVEMRLAAAGKPFASRDVWRAAYALGLTWGEMDLFHWADPATGTPLFTLSALGQPGYFLPERAAEGERVPGIALGFELPTAPAPVETYDRMAVALDYLRQRLGGRPATPDGADLDGDRLWSDRDALADAVAEMRRAGIAPGSPEAARYF